MFSWLVAIRPSLTLPVRCRRNTRQTVGASDRLSPMKLLLSFILLAGTAASPFAGAQNATMPSHPAHATAQPSTALSVSAGDKHIVLSPGDLQALPQASVTVLNGHTKAEETYTGPLVSDVLAKAGALLSSATERDVLHSYVVATGTDGYFVVFSGAELQGALHKAQCIVAITRDGQPLTEHGAFQLVDSLDVKPARWVRNLKGLTVLAVGQRQ